MNLWIADSESEVKNGKILRDYSSKEMFWFEGIRGCENDECKDIFRMNCNSRKKSFGVSKSFLCILYEFWDTEIWWKKKKEKISPL